LLTGLNSRKTFAMRWIAILAAGVGFTATGLVTEPAQAQSGQRAYHRNSTVIVTQDENGRRRTRVVVNRRSYLDGGTEVLPGERGYHDYAQPLYWNPYRVLGPRDDLSQTALPNAMDLNKLGPRIGY
jgi:hypothetical protein